MTTDRFKELADDDAEIRSAAIPAEERVEDPEGLSNLQPLPRARWRSLGEHLDYTRWPERERFLELDREIKAAPRDPGHQRSEARTQASASSKSPNHAKGARVGQRIGRIAPKSDEADFDNVLTSKTNMVRRVKAR